MDLTGVKAAVEEINTKTIPELDAVAQKLAEKLVDGLHSVLERLDGAQIMVTINVPPRHY